MKERAAALLAGCILDLIIGDPHWIYHPVQAIGAVITGLETVLRHLTGNRGKQAELWAGRVLTVLVVLISVSIPWLVLKAAYYVHPILGFVVESLFCGQLLAARSLYDESWKVGKALKKGDVREARKLVSMIVGRDTERLDEAGITRAAVETVAENTSDGVIAPFFYMALFGAAGGFFYKAVNTMDSMIGYKNEKYLYFGRAAARLDDLCNYIPARLGAVLLTGSAFLLGYDGKEGWRIYKRDRYCHASPNSAHGEAVIAGALHLRLAGDAWYFGKLHQKPYIGDDIRPPEPEDIRRAGRIMFGAEGLMLALYLAIALKGWI